MGRIAAGVPIDAIQHKTHSITVPPEMISGGDHYALEVKGDSMIEAGIFDGDTVIIKQSSNANPGEIVVALVDDEEATLKRFRRKGASIALEAANPAYETRIFGPDRVKVQGKLVIRALIMLVFGASDPSRKCSAARVSGTRASWSALSLTASCAFAAMQPAAQSSKQPAANAGSIRPR
jgi:hypothetical protein